MFSGLHGAEDAARRTRPLSELKTGIKADVWLFDNYTFRGYVISNLDGGLIQISNAEESRRIEFSDIYQVRIGEDIYTDEMASYYELLPLELASDYLQKYGDFAIDNDFRTTYGKIVLVSNAALHIRSNQTTVIIPKDQLLRYRKERQLTTTNDKPIAWAWLGSFPKGTDEEPILGRFLNNKNHLTEFTVGIASPLNVFPQLSLGLQTNPNWPIFLGIRGGASGQFITAGWIYAQAQVFAGIRLPDIAFVRTGLIFGYAYRNHIDSIPFSCGAGCSSDFASVAIAQKNYYLALTLRFRAIYLELGWEVKDYFSYSITTPKPTSGSFSPEQQQRVTDTAKFLESQSDFISDFSRFYFAAGIRIAFL